MISGGVGEFSPSALRFEEEGGLAGALRRDGHFEFSLSKEEKWLRYYHYVRGKTDFRLFFNESPSEKIDCGLSIPGGAGGAVWYDPWTDESFQCPEGEPLKVTLSPYEMKILVLDRGEGAVPAALPARKYALKQTISAEGWRISLREAGSQTEILSGRERLGDLDGKEAGVCVAPPYDFSVTGLLRPGRNRLKVLVANTLVHRLRDPLSMTLPMEPSGLTGPVTLSWEE